MRVPSDPVFVRPDGYAGPKGLSWLYRSMPGVPGMAGWDDAAEAELTRRFGGS